VVVEGTETEEQIAWLSGLGNIEAQGFLFSRPVPPEGVQALLERFGVCAQTEPGGVAPTSASESRVSV
jgi:EAL domain-containing protein (putative c-di-GMP-specific phosphodiesterase class I)